MIKVRSIKHEVGIEKPVKVDLTEEDKRRVREGTCQYTEKVFRIFCCSSKIKEGVCDYQSKRTINWEDEGDPLHICLLKEKRLYD